MRDYIISCCSTADLTEEHFKARDISYICFHFELNGKEYADDLGKSIPFDQFYAAMAPEPIRRLHRSMPKNLKNISNLSLKQEKISCISHFHPEFQE